MAIEPLTLLKLANPWWQEPAACFQKEKEFPKRKVFGQLSSWLKPRMIIGLSGLRRVGKTTLMRQMINQLLPILADKRQLLYFSFEENWSGQREEVLEPILYGYFKRILRISPLKLSSRVYIFLDEIQYARNWPNLLKRFYDQNENIKFVISGSLSLTLRTDTKESLAGRALEIFVPPLSFNEFLDLKKEVPVPSFLENDFNFEKWKDQYEKKLIDPEKTSDLFGEYLCSGQFPETVDLEVAEAKTYLLLAVINKILDSDIPRVFKTRKREELRLIFEAVTAESGNLFSYESWSLETGISLYKIKKTITYLSTAFLIDEVYNLSSSKRKRFRVLRKIYTGSPNFMATILDFSPESLVFEKNKGFLAETFVYQQLQEKFSKRQVFFWRERKNEVDFIVLLAGETFSIEVKYRQRIGNEDWKSLFYFLGKKKLSQGYILTSQEYGKIEREGKKIFLVPVWAL